MSRTTPADPLVDTWRELLTQHARAHAAIDRALEAHDLGVSEYEVLDRLAGDPDGHQRRMVELGEAVHLSQSALSRVVGRLERDGLASRCMCPDDRRGIYVSITDAGRRRHEEALPAHRAALVEALSR